MEGIFVLIIGICGASGSGKSTLAKALAGKLEKNCIYLKQDSYYKDHPNIHVFYDASVRELLDFKIYIQVDPDVCLLRRVKRDMRDRGRSIEGIYRQYLETVKPMYEKHIRNYVEYADLIVAQGGKNARIVDILAHYINSGMIQSQ